MNPKIRPKTSSPIRFLQPLPAVALVALLAIQGCATDPNAGAQSIGGMKVSGDPCTKSASVMGAPAVTQFSKSADVKASGAAAGGGIGYNVEVRRCMLLQVAKDHKSELTVSPVIVPKGDLPPAAVVAAAAPEKRFTSATPFMPGGANATAGLSLTLRDSGLQFAPGSDRLTPDAEALLRDIAVFYSYPRQLAKLAPTASEDERGGVEALKNKRILFVGHTDDAGNSTDNANLSERRAASVARLFQQQGVAAANLFFQGAGEALPVADNHTEEGRAANRRVEIVDVTDDAALRKFLAARRQVLAYYRGTGPLPAATTPEPAPAPAKPAKGVPKGRSSVIDFGGVPASTIVTAVDFGASAPPPSGTAAKDDRPVVPSCLADRPRVANAVKALATQQELPAADYVPGLYNTSWSDTVNGHLVGLTNVDVLRDGGSATEKPTLFIWKNYNSKKKMPPADFQATPDVNVYRGARAILYRIFVTGPMKCMDVVFPYTDTGDARNSSLVYDHQSSMYVATFELKSLSGSQGTP